MTALRHLLDTACALIARDRDVRIIRACALRPGDVFATEHNPSWRVVLSVEHVAGGPTQHVYVNITLPMGSAVLGGDAPVIRREVKR